MDIETRDDGNEVTIAIRGRVTVEDMEALGQRVATLIQEGHRRLILDLAAVSLIDSAGLGQLVRIFTALRRQGGTVQVKNAGGRTLEFLSTTNTLGVFAAATQRKRRRAAALVGLGLLVLCALGWMAWRVWPTR